jgi:hypothetical protein
MTLDFKILRGNKSTLIDENGVVLIPEEKLVNGYWYLTNDTAEVFVCLNVAGQLTLKKINECDDTTDWDEVRIQDIEERLTALEESSDVEVFGYRYLFPTTGVENKLYVAADEEKSYVWFNNDYLPVGGESSQPDVILGGTAG